MKKILSVITLLLCSCNHKYDSNVSSKIIIDLTTTENVQEDKYIQAIDELETMLCEVCNMADSLVKRGVRRGDVRDSLKYNSQYLLIAEQAAVLDSIVLAYMNRPTDVPLVWEKYNSVLRKYNKKAASLGLI